MKRLNGVEKMLKNKLKEVRKVYPQARINEVNLRYKNQKVIAFYDGVDSEFEYHFSKDLYFTLNAGKMSSTYYERLSDLKASVDVCQWGNPDKLKFKAIVKKFGIVVKNVKVKKGKRK